MSRTGGVAARPDVAALCLVALSVLDRLAARGLETRDEVRLWLDASLRVSRGAQDPRSLSCLTRSVRSLRGLGGDAAMAHMAAVCEAILRERQRLSARPVPVMAACGAALSSFVGEEREASRAIVRSSFWLAYEAESPAEDDPAEAA